MNYKELEKLNEIIKNLKATPNADENIQFVLKLAQESITRETLNNLIENVKPTALMPCNEEQGNQAKDGLKFTTKEIDQMPKTFKKEFRAEGCTARIRKRQTGKNSYTYEIRYRRNGYNITITDKNLENGKQRFLAALKTAKPVEKGLGVPTTFDGFTTYYFEKFRKPKVAEQTYKNDRYRYKKQIQPVFGCKQIKQVTPAECQNLIDSILAEGKGKTADEIYSLLSIIFKGAIAHRIIEHNPLSIVVKSKHQYKHGTALSKEEETSLLSKYAGTKLQSVFALALYTGLRPNEYKTAKIDGKFIVAVNSKRKTKQVEYKKIPITKMLAPYLKGVDKFEIPCKEVLYKRFKEVLPNHILYDMRTTFYSRCKECGIAEHALKEFVGHSLGELGNAYTDLSDEYLLREGEKFVY